MSNRGEGGESRGFPAVSAVDARVLVLGSLPGARSIAEQQYYAHPRNAFWPVMRELYGIDGDYRERCQKLTDRGIALWDVLGSSVRPGSMDADIDVGTAQPNNFATFLDEHRQLRRICFNGRKAEQLFERLVAGLIAGELPERVVLPSTSPAFASMPFESKLEQWRAALTTARRPAG